MVFLTISIVNTLKLDLENSSNANATACQLLLLFWKAVEIFEKCNIKTLGVTCNGVSVNRKFFKMHFTLVYDNRNFDVTYGSINLFNDKQQYIYFRSDLLHLIKTSRNCLNSSGVNKSLCFMRNDSSFLTWTHISK